MQVFSSSSSFSIREFYNFIADCMALVAIVILNHSELLCVKFDLFIFLQRDKKSFQKGKILGKKVDKQMVI